MKYHLDYFDKFGNEAAEWVVARAKNASGITTGSGDKTSGASDMLKNGIKHPVANIFMLLIVLFGL